MGTATKHTVPDQVKPWTSECPVWYRVL